MWHGGRREGCWETDGKRQVGSPRRKWEENIKLDLKGAERIILAQVRNKYGMLNW
jgi:hypothetical protein